MISQNKCEKQLSLFLPCSALVFMFAVSWRFSPCDLTRFPLFFHLDLARRKTKSTREPHQVEVCDLRDPDEKQS